MSVVYLSVLPKSWSAMYRLLLKLPAAQPSAMYPRLPMCGTIQLPSTTSTELALFPGLLHLALTTETFATPLRSNLPGHVAPGLSASVTTVGSPPCRKTPRPCFRTFGEGSPETTPWRGSLVRLSGSASSCKKQTSVKPAMPRALPHTQAPHRSYPSHVEQHISGEVTRCSSRKSPPGWYSTFSSIRPQLRSSAISTSLPGPVRSRARAASIRRAPRHADATAASTSSDARPCQRRSPPRAAATPPLSPRTYVSSRGSWSPASICRGAVGL
mmetsp:Transcript_103838/g.293653  ORF Transcript_103838/g.293653 Transcript_103838/m.293653 type:complete len:271 (+) Transcript_103838:690-1502(+)